MTRPARSEYSIAIPPLGFIHLYLVFPVLACPDASISSTAFERRPLPRQPGLEEVEHHCFVATHTHQASQDIVL
jgi:hypothetical protein